MRPLGGRGREGRPAWVSCGAASPPIDFLGRALQPGWHQCPLRLPLHPLRAPGGARSGTQRVSGSGGFSDRSKDPAFQATPGRGDGVAFQLPAERGLGTKTMVLAWARPQEAAFPQGRGRESLLPVTA